MKIGINGFGRIGRLVFRAAVQHPNIEIVISAQHRLEGFYNELGFSARGDVYLEDDIDHIQMFLLKN